MLNEKTFKSIYEDFLESGLSIRSYCSNQCINEAKFYYWQRRLKSQLPPRKGFVPIVFEKGGLAERFPLAPSRPGHAETASGNGSSFCEITYPNGVTLKLHGGADLETLRSLLLLGH